MEKPPPSSQCKRISTTNIPIMTPYGQLSSFPKVSFKLVNLKSFPLIPSHQSNAPNVSSCSSAVEWTRLEDKLFENAIAMIDENDPNRWEKIATQLPKKTIEQIKDHYELLLEDVHNIDSGDITIPRYLDDDEYDVEEEKALDKDDVKNMDYNPSIKGKGPLVHDKKKKSRTVKRKKGIPWTDQEHRLFLLGLNKYGKGDWKTISRNCVKTKTPTQVASHAQKYFNRSNKSAARTKESHPTGIHVVENIINTSKNAPIYSFLPTPANNQPQVVDPAIQASNISTTAILPKVPFNLNDRNKSTLRDFSSNSLNTGFDNYLLSNLINQFENYPTNNFSGGLGNFQASSDAFWNAPSSNLSAGVIAVGNNLPQSSNIGGFGKSSVGSSNMPFLPESSSTGFGNLPSVSNILNSGFGSMPSHQNSLSTGFCNMPLNNFSGGFVNSPSNSSSEEFTNYLLSPKDVDVDFGNYTSNYLNDGDNLKDKDGNYPASSSKG